MQACSHSETNEKKNHNTLCFGFLVWDLGPGAKATKTHAYFILWLLQGGRKAQIERVLKHFDKCWGENKIPGFLHKPPLEKQLQQRGISFCLLRRLWHVMNRFSLPLICQTYYKAMSFVGAESRERKEDNICLPRFLLCWSEMRDFLSKINISFHLIPNQQRSGELQVYTGYERGK